MMFDPQQSSPAKGPAVEGHMPKGSWAGSLELVMLFRRVGETLGQTP